MPMVGGGGVDVVDGGGDVELRVRVLPRRRLGMRQMSLVWRLRLLVRLLLVRLLRREEVRAAERRPESRDGGDRGERGGRERGGRDRGGRDRGGRDRGGREASGGREAVGRDSRLDSVRERFAPRGARPAAADDEVVDLNASAGPAVEPFILPGESLSKYRRGENGAAESAARQACECELAVVAKPSTEVAPLVGWDGGAVLPGETLRAREPRGGETRGGDSRGEGSWGP